MFRLYFSSVNVSICFQYCVTVGKESGARNLAKIIHKIQPNKSARILDVACGNGLLGIEVRFGRVGSLYIYGMYYCSLQYFSEQK